MVINAIEEPKKSADWIIKPIIRDTRILLQYFDSWSI